MTMTVMPKAHPNKIPMIPEGCRLAAGAGAWLEAGAAVGPDDFEGDRVAGTDVELEEDGDVEVDEDVNVKFDATFIICGRSNRPSDPIGAEAQSGTELLSNTPELWLLSIHCDNAGSFMNMDIPRLWIASTVEFGRSWQVPQANPTL